MAGPPGSRPGPGLNPAASSWEPGTAPGGPSAERAQTGQPTAQNIPPGGHQQGHRGGHRGGRGVGRGGGPGGGPGGGSRGGFQGGRQQGVPGRGGFAQAPGPQNRNVLAGRGRQPPVTLPPHLLPTNLPIDRMGRGFNIPTIGGTGPPRPPLPDLLALSGHGPGGRPVAPGVPHPQTQQVVPSSGPRGNNNQGGAAAAGPPASRRNRRNGRGRGSSSSGGGSNSDGNGNGNGNNGALTTTQQQSTIVPPEPFDGQHTTAAWAGEEFGEPILDTSEDKLLGPKLPPSQASTLTARIHEDIDNGTYECIICLVSVKRTSRIWVCTACYNVTHFSCVATWLNLLEYHSDDPVSARCPACNSGVPCTESARSVYYCWCDKRKKRDVAPLALPPHSCGLVCGKARTGCPHTCPATCHAGPCPPCTEPGPTTVCSCGKQTSTLPCKQTAYDQPWSCGKVCGNILSCGLHKCTRVCHPGACLPCSVPAPSICYCGKRRKTVSCNKRGRALPSFDYGQLGAADDDEESSAPPDVPDDAQNSSSLRQSSRRRIDSLTDSVSKGSSFEGSFSCHSLCQRAFDCGVHACSKTCHPQDEKPAHCPFSPDVVTHCPCGKMPVRQLTNELRRSCLDQVPTCGNTCDKLLACGHACPRTCHVGACPPCEEQISARCLCGRQQWEKICGDEDARADLRCNHVCRATLSCGQHVCNRTCCSGWTKALQRRAAAKGRQPVTALNDVEAEHICVRRCGRVLNCGIHECPLMCHSGPCLSCTAYVNEELRCPCGQTVVPPPFPCGTQLPICDADCTRQPPCGHARVPHQCHGDSQPCPRCQQLVSKSCRCGKTVLNRVACGARDIRCETVCGQPLKCGVHTCKLRCHGPGECEDARHDGSGCKQTCGRPKALCGHPCDKECHERSDCVETKPCKSTVLVTCPCHRREQQVRCTACTTNTSPSRPILTCDDECLRIQRNNNLKAALNISDTHEAEHNPYSPETLRFFQKNRTWATAQEHAFRVFADNESGRRYNFKPMPAGKRAFLHMLAKDFGLESLSQDPEPHRHVSLYKPARFVAAPSKTLLGVTNELHAKERQRVAETASAAASQDGVAAVSSSTSSPSPGLAAFVALQRRPFNAVLIPASRAKKRTSDGDESNNTLRTILEAWREQEALPVEASPAVRVPLPNGDLLVKIAIPAAAPAARERLLRFVVSYLDNCLGGAGSEAEPIRLCYVDANNKVVWCEGDYKADGPPASRAQDENADGAEHEASQWNVVAGRATRREASGNVSASVSTPASASTSSATAPRERALFRLKKTPMTPAAETAERQKRWQILAQQLVDGQEKDANDNTSSSEAGNDAGGPSEEKT